jgi:hypothetical protein
MGRIGWIGAAAVAGVVAMLGGCASAPVSAAKPVTVDAVVMLVGEPTLKFQAQAIDWGDALHRNRRGTRTVSLDLSQDQPADGAVVLSDDQATALRKQVEGEANSGVVGRLALGVLDDATGSQTITYNPAVRGVSAVTLEAHPRLEVYDLIALQLGLTVTTPDGPSAVRARFTGKGGRWLVVVGPRIEADTATNRPATRVVLLVRARVGPAGGA